MIYCAKSMQNKLIQWEKDHQSCCQTSNRHGCKGSSNPEISTNSNRPCNGLKRIELQQSSSTKKSLADSKNQELNATRNGPNSNQSSKHKGDESSKTWYPSINQWRDLSHSTKRTTKTHQEECTLQEKEDINQDGDEGSNMSKRTQWASN